MDSPVSVYLFSCFWDLLYALWVSFHTSQCYLFICLFKVVIPYKEELTLRVLNLPEQEQEAHVYYRHCS